MTEIESLRAYIARKQQKIDDLIERHGQGVRAAWVSEELAMLTFYKRDAENELKRLEGQK